MPLCYVLRRPGEESYICWGQPRLLLGNLPWVLFTEGSGAEIKDSRENEFLRFHFLQVDDRVAVDPVCECVGAMFANVSMCVGDAHVCVGLRSWSGVSH